MLYWVKMEKAYFLSEGIGGMCILLPYGLVTTDKEWFLTEEENKIPVIRHHYNSIIVKEKA